MKTNKDIVEAVANLPEELLTDAIVREAAGEHDPRLLHYLPERYRTPELIERIFDTDTPTGWQRWDMEYIPQECRTYNICLRAVVNNRNNLRHVPEPLRSGDILKQALTGRGVLHLLDLIPQAAWTKELACHVLLHNAPSTRSWNRTVDNACQERIVQVILSFIPKRIRNAAFYLTLLQKQILPIATLQHLTPHGFRTRRYLLALAALDYAQVPVEKYDYGLLRAALFSDKNMVGRMMDSEAMQEKILSLLTDELADRIVSESPYDFRKLPERFRTSERLLLAVEHDSQRRYYNDSLVGGEDRRLLSREVCEAFVRRGFDIPELPQEVWTEDFVAYCLEHGPSFEWIRQTPRHLITWEVGTLVYEEHPDLVGYLPRRYLTPERTRKLYRKMPSLKDELPRHHFTEFSKQTGLSEGFYGGEVSLAELKRERREFSYCRIGNTYLGLYRTGRYSSADTLLIMTRASKSYIPAEPVFCHRIDTFHRTWLEKTVADHDPQFRKPKVPAALKDVQALCYYDVEPVRTVFGTTFYRNTFMGQTVGYCIRRAGITYHDDDFDDLISGWKRKWKEMQCSGQESDPQQIVDARYLHAKLGYCKTGIAAFAEDYGLDPSGSYTIAQLRETIQKVGHRPSLHAYRLELRAIHII